MSRVADYPIDEIFLNRWSPRAMNGAPLSDADLMKLFEAARWSPSASNVQPWRFIYAKQGTPHFAKFFDLLVAFNQLWCAKAGALVIIVSKTTLDDGRPFRTHSFDTGAAWMGLALQASLAGIVAHGMGGFDHDRAARAAQLPEGYAVEAMLALGYPGNKDDLPEQLRSRESPNSRKPIAEIVFEGVLKT
jgi:nitroreductase